MNEMLSKHRRNRVGGHNGVLPLSLGWRGLWKKITLVGGPYAEFPGNGYYGVCLREYEPDEYNVWLPIDDFSVPRDRDDVVAAIKETVAAAIDGEVVYAGCMGGWGRTGLFMALVAKAVGHEDPISYVRQMYTPRAVETKEQERYVEEFDVSWFNTWLLKTTWRHIKGMPLT